MYTGSLSNTFLMLLLTFSQISLYLFIDLSPFIKKDICELIFGTNRHKGLTFLPSLYPITYLKPFLTKGSVKVFSVDYNAINTNDILDVHR